MPQIIVMAGGGVENGGVMLRERVNAADFESERFAANLLERLGWAVEDATAAEQARPVEHATAAEQARPDTDQRTGVPEPDLDPGYAWDPEPLGVS
jgi:hypothetical protein